MPLCLHVLCSGFIRYDLYFLLPYTYLASVLIPAAVPCGRRRWSVVQSKTFVPTGSSGAHDVQIKQNKSFPLGCHCGRLNMINCPPGCLSSEQNMVNSLFSPVPLIRPATARRQHSTNMYQCNKTTECNVTARENMNFLCAYAMNI